MTQSTTSRTEAVEKLAKLVKDIGIGMLTTIMPDGALHSRPMARQKTEFDGNLWFMTGNDTAKVHEVSKDKRVNVTFANPDDNAYVSISGTASVVRDRAKIDELWSPLYKAWFPKGKDDPNITLLKVSVEQAEFWDVPSSKMVQLIGFVKSIVTGTPYDPGENKKMTLKRKSSPTKPSRKRAKTATVR